MVCGSGADSLPAFPVGDLTKPLLSVEPNRIVDAYGQYMRLLAVEPLGGGRYAGSGQVLVDLLKGLEFTVRFQRLFIDENGLVGDGEIVMVSRGMKAALAGQGGSLIRLDTLFNRLN